MYHKEAAQFLAPAQSKCPTPHLNKCLLGVLIDLDTFQGILFSYLLVVVCEEEDGEESDERGGRLEKYGAS